MDREVEWAGEGGGREAGEKAEAKRTEWQARVVAQWTLKWTLSVGSQGSALGTPEVLASEIREGKDKNRITMGYIRINWTEE